MPRGGFCICAKGRESSPHALTLIPTTRDFRRREISYAVCERGTLLFFSTVGNGFSSMKVNDARRNGIYVTYTHIFSFLYLYTRGSRFHIILTLNRNARGNFTRDF